MMIELDDAQRKLLEQVRVAGSERVDLGGACGRTLKADVRATIRLPPFDNSAMDGYAVRSEDLANLPASLTVVGVSSAGRPSDATIGAGECVRILTGAVLVDGADTVVPVESTNGGTDEVLVFDAPQRGAHVRSAGELVQPGAVVIAAGTKLNAGHLGVVASLGLEHVEVNRVPRVSLLSTGDELVRPGSGELGPGQIFESNTVVLESLLHKLGCSTNTVRGGDDADSLAELLVTLAGESDLIISTGGVSMGGEYDALKVAALRFGVEAIQVSIKPAKPLAFGLIDEALLIGLPGNPTSAVVAFELFVRPAINKMSGASPVIAERGVGVLTSEVQRPDDGKVHFVGVNRDRSGGWTPNSLKSHDISGLANAEALAVIPAENLLTAVGSEVELIPLWA